MKPLRVTDEYVELAATPARGMVELFVTAPGSASVLQAHVPEKLAWRLGLWLLFWFVWERMLGWKSRKELREHRDMLLKLEEEDSED
jgi:hypothetical protein